MVLVKPTTGWDKIATEYVPPADGEHVCKIIEIVDDEKTTNNDLEQVIIGLQVDDEGDPENGKTIRQYIVLETKTHEENKVGMGQLKQYFIAVLGEEAVADPEAELDTDELLDQHVKAVIKSRKYKDKTTDEIVTRTEVKRVLPLD